MNSLLSNGEDKSLSALKDPFKQDKVEGIHIHIHMPNRESVFEHRRKLRCRATVCFSNGKTQGKQNFDSDDYNNLIKEIEEFIQSL